MNLTTKEVETRIKKEYPHGLDLVYIDYRDSFNENEKIMEELAQTGFVDSVDMDWITDNQYDSIDYVKKTLFNENEVEKINADDELKEAVEQTLFSLDNSNPVKDLLHHTNRRYFYYDLDLEIEAGFYNDGFYNHTKEKWPETEMRKIARKLRISYKKYEKELRELVINADYGGQLVILFTYDPEDLFGESTKYIKFKDNFDLCIMDRGNGSGYNLPIKKELVFEFKRQNLHDDEGDNGYSYSGDVCGLVKGDTAKIEFSNVLWKKDKAIPVQTNEEAEARRKQEELYEKRWKEGKCTFGDMNIKRHEDTPYRTEYPAGNKCTACGTFWID